MIRAPSDPSDTASWIALRLGATYADNSARLRRTVLFAGFADTPTARTGGSTVQGFGELGYKIPLGSAAPAALISKGSAVPAQAALAYIEPFVGGAVVSIGRDRFVETGGVAALTGAARDYDRHRAPAACGFGQCRQRDLGPRDVTRASPKRLCRSSRLSSGRKRDRR